MEEIDAVLRLLVWLEEVENAGQQSFGQDEPDAI
jgi:hypothetical protein